MKRIVLVLVLLAGAGAGVWFGFFADGRNGNGALRLYGNVDIREVELAFRVPGRLAEVRVDEGDAVKAGDVVAVLDSQPYRNALDKARGLRDQAEADASKYRFGYRREEVAQAKAQVAELEARVENAVRVARRLEQLLKSGAIAAQDLDDAVADRDAYQAALQKARKDFDLHHSGYRAEEVLGAEASLRAAEAEVASALTDLADTEIIAPSNGTVLSRVREPGAMATAGSTVLVVALERPVWVRAYVSEASLGKVHPGMLMDVYTDSRPDKPYLGRVGFISPVAEFTPKNVETESLRTDLVYRLRIIIDHPDEMLRQGMPVTVTASADATAVPGPPPSDYVHDNASYPTVKDPTAPAGLNSTLPAAEGVRQ